MLDAMENLDTNDLIEQYLDGSLPPAEQQAMEARLATDADFRADVELHRQLHEEFADPKKLELRDMLSDILREPPPPAKYGWLKGLGIVLAVLLAGWMGWRWISPAPAPAPAEQEEIKSNLPPTEPVATPETRDVPPDPSEKAPQSPIAMADPAAFAPNREFEDRLGSGVRATDGSADMKSPAMGADFALENGQVKITFRGTAPADADTARYPLALKIYTNRPVSSQAPPLRVLPTISNRSAATGKWAFYAPQTLRLRPGLYYFTLERQSDEEVLFVGKFTVGAR